MSKDKDFADILNALGENYLKKVNQKLSDLIKKKNIKSMLNESHKLKGSGKTYGFNKISTASKEIEAFCKQFVDSKTDQLQKNKIFMIKKIKKLKSLTEVYQKLIIKK